MSSWKALAWAKNQPAGSALAKVVLLLLAERADERYSCFPNLATLAEEADSNRRSVRRVIRSLEERGLITTVARTRESGVSTSNRYFINHPEAPHVEGVSSAYEAVSVGGQIVRGAGDKLSGGGGRDVRGRGTSGPPTGRTSCPPLNYPDEHPTDQGSDGEIQDDQPRLVAGEVLDGLAELDSRMRFSPRDRALLAPFVSAAINTGWPASALKRHLIRELPAEVGNPAGLVRSRLTDGLPPPPAVSPTQQLPELCGKCDNRWIQSPGGKLVRCPRCHPRAVNPVRERRNPGDVAAPGIVPGCSSTSVAQS
jgi:hypothetical protein